VVGNGILLDTGILVHMVREDSTGVFVRQNYSPLLTEPRPLISVVTEGEIRSLAYLWKWGEWKRRQMAFLLDYFDRATIEADEILEAYAVLDSYSESTGRPMGENDAWIAATAHVTGRTLLTTDQDFDHLHPMHLIREYVGGAE
jgi:tRNA(fMet)-specific endonuclease VapC